MTLELPMVGQNGHGHGNGASIGQRSIPDALTEGVSELEAEFERDGRAIRQVGA